MPAIRIFEEGGNLHSLANRRLFAGQYADIDLPYQWATPADVARSESDTDLWRNIDRHSDGWRSEGVVASVSEYPGLRGRDQVLEAVEQLQTDLESGVEWENDTISRFLDGFGALLGSIENAYVNTDRPVPDDPWVILAEVLRGARFYE